MDFRDTSWRYYESECSSMLRIFQLEQFRGTLGIQFMRQRVMYTLLQTRPYIIFRPIWNGTVDLPVESHRLT